MRHGFDYGQSGSINTSPGGNVKSTTFTVTFADGGEPPPDVPVATEPAPEPKKPRRVYVALADVSDVALNADDWSFDSLVHGSHFVLNVTLGKGEQKTVVGSFPAESVRGVYYID